MFFSFLQLNFIRRCGFADDIFYIEVGRLTVTGDGEFWMAVEDNNIALNMYDVITSAMKNSKSNKDEGSQRRRSSSANEASKPISVLQRRHTGQKIGPSFSPLGKLRFSYMSIFPCTYRLSNVIYTRNVGYRSLQNVSRITTYVYLS